MAEFLGFSRLTDGQRECRPRGHLGGASGIRTLGTLRCSGSRSRWDYILRWDSRCRRWTGTTGVLLSEPGQSPGKDRSGRKAPWIAQPALRMRERIAPGASRVSAAVLRAAGPNEPHMNLAPVRCAWCCGCPIPRRLRVLCPNLRRIGFLGDGRALSDLGAWGRGTPHDPFDRHRRGHLPPGVASDGLSSQQAFA